MAAQRVTMSDVASAAGVSLMTVSRVVNQKEGVSPETRQSILEVIKKLNYRPSGIARSLATQRTGTLGLVVQDVSNPFFSEVAHGVEREASAEGYSVLLCNAEEDSQQEIEVLHVLEEKRVDGVVLCSSRLTPKQLGEILSRHPAVVLVNRPLPKNSGAAPVASVILDDVRGGQMAAGHLIDRGHQKIGFLKGPSASFSGRHRAKGLRLALKGAGLPYNPSWVVSCAPTVNGGYQAAYRLLNSSPEITGLFCYNDLVAVGALKACDALGVRVPDDLAIVGFDDIPLAALVTPSLTTCRVSPGELGRQATLMLLDCLRGCTDRGQKVFQQPQLIVRASAP